MTVSNVFNGKKVVQQIFLGQTEIYKSKGWTTLPGSIGENWYINNLDGNAGALLITSIDTDSQGNIFYVLGGSIYKTDSKASSPVLLRGVSSGYTVGKLIVDKADNDALYVLDRYPNLYKYVKDSQGNYSKDSTFTLGSSYRIDDFCIGTDSLYTIQQSDSNSLFYLYRYSKSDGSVLGNSYSGYSINSSNGGVGMLRSTATSLYVVSSGNAYISCYPIDFGVNANSINIPGLSGKIIYGFGTDSLGYLYTACSDNCIYKYDSQGNQIFRVAIQNGDYISSSYNRFLVFDSKDNFYTGDITTYYPYIYEYSSDGTFIASFNTVNGICATPAIDKNDIIYIPTYSHGLYQLFNIQKEE